MRVTVWNEYIDDKIDEEVIKVYPKTIHGTIAEFVEKAGHEVRCATLDEVECGLTEEVLDNTDVLIWWGHKGHDLVSDEIVERVQRRVLKGMGLIVLHSAHFSKIFKRLMGTSCDLQVRNSGDVERLWVTDPSHPIADGIGKVIELEHEEMFGEQYDIPTPDEVVFTSWFSGGEIFRSGCTFKRGNGKIFYFRPGHEMYPTYHNEDIQKVICNAVKWAEPTKRSYPYL